MLLAEIARQAQVSPATVSRAINQPELVARESLERIRAVMQEHDYQPAPLSRRRGPKSRKPASLRIGVWFVGAKAGNPSLNWFQDSIAQMEGSTPRQQIDLRMVFSNSPGELPPALLREKFDGVVMQGMEPAPEVLAKLANLPHVWFMTRRSESYPGDFVEPNNEENARLALDYLAERGHRRVAVLTTDPGYSANARRIAAFLRRAEQRGLPADRLLGSDDSEVSYLNIDPRNSETDDLVARFVELNPRPTGIYIPADHLAGSFFRALRTAGLQRGQDYEVVLGNYNPMIYHNLEHHPACIDINLPTLVRRVIDHLVWRIENPDSPGRAGMAVSPTLRPALD